MEWAPVVALLGLVIAFVLVAWEAGRRDREKGGPH
jgi:hypothetical protein